jgi:hypothetical protein
MTQRIQISRIVNSCLGLADQGGVLEGVADKPFFRTSPSLVLFFLQFKVYMPVVLHDTRRSGEKGLVMTTGMTDDAAYSNLHA